MKRITKLLVLSVFSLVLLSGCFNNNLALQREKNVSRGDNILIGVPVPLKFAQKNTNFLKGIDLALEDINAEGVNGKKIEVQIVDDKGNFKTAVDVAQEFSANTHMLAVIGHWYSDICIPVSSIYEEAGMLTIIPTVSNPEVTDKGYRYIFQSITSDKKIAEEMCAYAKSKGYEKIVVCYEDSSYGQNLANAIEEGASKYQIKIVDRSCGLLTNEQFKKAHDKWQALDFDVVLLALNMPEGGNYIKVLRAMNKDAGIICADGLDVSNLIRELGKDAEGIVIATTYSPYEQRPELDSFNEKYHHKYNEEPDVWAIQGYDSLQVIAHAIKQTNSYSPTVLADFLRQMKPWQTVSGQIRFNQFGQIDGREIHKKIVVNGQFQYID